MYMKPLTMEEIYQAAPAVFTMGNADRCSDKYKHGDTLQAIRILDKEGYRVVDAGIVRTRKRENGPYAKHKVVFRHVDDINIYTPREIVPQVVMFNSHNALSALLFFSGLLRFYCDNGLYTGKAGIQKNRVLHKGNDFDTRLVYAMDTAMSGAKQATLVYDQWKSIELTQLERYEFADAASELVDSPLSYSLLEARRVEDKGHDLWTVFNVVQENIIKGGQSYRKVNDMGTVRRNKTRAVKNFERDTKINQDLWQLAIQFAGRAA